MPNEYQKFCDETGLSISRSTYYRLKADARAGANNRLGRIMLRETLPPSQYRRGAKWNLQMTPEEKRLYHNRSHNREAKVVADRRPFMAFDGEGRTLEGKHKYVLLACSDGTHAYNESGLSTSECLNFILQKARGKPSIRIWYSFGYDVQQMLVDLPDESLVRVMHGGLVRFGPYRIQYMAGKIFIVNNVRFYDVFAFWQKSFIKAVSESLGPDSVSRDLVKGKEARGSFAEWDIRDILRYTNEELSLLVKLANHLRSIFLRADIHLGSAFYGPGSIANYWFKKEGIAPPKIQEAALVDVMERAYYGGRFETFKLGKVEDIYECDINSAYPAVMAGLPYLDKWTKCGAGEYSSTHPSMEFSVWHIQWNLPVGEPLGPFPSRDKHGLISYPRTGIGWYWKPEVDAALALFGKSCFQISEGYFPEEVYEQPFSWIKDIYERRQQLKRENDPAQLAFKIGLNSLYGKTAQRIGTAKYFSLAWAGYITSATRAKLLRATIEVGTSHVVAYATDALYTDKVPRSGDFGKGLGQFSKEHWDRGYFIQSGVYRLERRPLESDSGKPLYCETCGDKLRSGQSICSQDKGLGILRKDAYRGYHVEKGIQDIFDQITAHPHRHPRLYQTKFIGHLEAIKCPKALGPYRLCFILIEKKIKPYKTTKRKVLDPDVWSLLETDDGEWIEPGFKHNPGPQLSMDELHKLLDEVQYTTDGNIAYNNYDLLLHRSVSNTILECHNDHSDFLTPADTGLLEESYPFTRITKREGDIALSASDGIAEERIGGALGIIPSRFKNNLPIVSEDDITKELEQHG